MLPQLIDPFPPQVKTLSLKSSHPFWNGHSIGRVVSKANATKKMRKIKRDNEAGLVDGTILMYHRYKDTNLQLPAVLTINWYKQIAMVENTRQEFRKYFIKKFRFWYSCSRTNDGYTCVGIIYIIAASNLPIRRRC